LRQDFCLRDENMLAKQFRLKAVLLQMNFYFYRRFQGEYSEKNK
jgi:hypothetical protein